MLADVNNRLMFRVSLGITECEQGLRKIVGMHQLCATVYISAS